ncbi:MAG TPA: chorismate synthase [bacterium]|nr:chorismate synthase [bacterium]
MLRYLTAGESHGEQLTAIVDGLPAGLPVDSRLINEDLARRQSGYGRGGRMQIEKDTVHITSGVRKGITIGSPVTVVIRNKDFKIDQLPAVTHPRPGHADLAGAIKYGRGDIRDILERASARETAARTAAGALCKLFLREFGIRVVSHVVELGGIRIAVPGMAAAEILKRTSRSKLNCADPAAETAMIARIDRAIEEKDTLGGVFEIVIENVPPGIGSHTQWDRRLNARLLHALGSIQAIKGVEVGIGFEAARLAGTEVHDEIGFAKGKGFRRLTNRAGGIEGGISNGEPIVLRAAMKPIATVGNPLGSVDIRTKKQCRATVERFDTCAVSAAGVVGEAVCAFVIAEGMIEKFGGDCMDEIQRNYASFKKYLKTF